LNSIAKNASSVRTYRAIVLHKGLSDENISGLTRLGCNNLKIEFVPMKRSLDEIADKMSNRLRCDYFTLTIYYRLFIPSMFPQYDKAIYIDSDVVVKGDMSKLFDTDMGDNLIGACTDKSVAEVPELTRYMQDAVGVPSEQYINSGVLLMNLRLLRERKLDEHFISLLTKYGFDSVAPDQDYLNAICNGKILYLDECWNVMPNSNKPLNADAMLIHYNLFSKPWCYDGIQYADEFWKYAEDCGYTDEIRAYKQSYSDEKKKADSECLERLVSRATEIIKNEVTFKKAFESGEKIRL